MIDAVRAPDNTGDSQVTHLGTVSLLIKNITFMVWFTWLLWQQHAGEHLLARVRIHVSLKGE